MVRFNCAVFMSTLLMMGGVESFTAPSVNNKYQQQQSSTELEMSLTSKAAIKAASVAAGAAVAGTVFVKKVLDKPSRTYYEPSSVADEYDAWTDDGILEYYWGEHIHMGYYSEAEMAKGYKKKDFVQAKYDFIDEMMKFGGIDPSADAEAKVLDVGCGFGGTSRYLAKKLGPKSQVTGITLSPNQVKRGTELAQEQGVPNAKFQVTNALDMSFPDNSFDIVWACESGEHMPDKEAYINEMMRVLKPGGKFVMCTWCQRDDSEVPFTKKDLRDLQYLYDEWSHPHFISIQAYEKLMKKTEMLENIKTDDWVDETLASWRHSIWVGVYDPRGWIFKPKQYLKCVRDAYCLERFHRAFKRGLMEYGMFTATKLPAPVVEKAEEAVSDAVDAVEDKLEEAKDDLSETEPIV